MPLGAGTFWLTPVKLPTMIATRYEDMGGVGSKVVVIILPPVEPDVLLGMLNSTVCSLGEVMEKFQIAYNCEYTTCELWVCHINACLSSLAIALPHRHKGMIVKDNVNQLATC